MTSSFLKWLCYDGRWDWSISHHEILDSRSPRLVPIPNSLHHRTRELITKSGISHLYTHQAAAIKSAVDGNDVVLATSTASGKTLAYQVPVLNTIMSKPEAAALLLFPLKALERDQKDAFEYIARDTNITIGVYDGDTPEPERLKIKSNPPNILITNPDMLHLGLLAYHGTWKSFFSRLSYIVLDEVHTYKGIFGTHISQVLRRTQRICKVYGSNPQFLSCSATVSNPGEFVSTLTGRETQVIDESGAATAERHFIFLKPELSPYTVASKIFVKSLKMGLKTIIFTRARKITELITTWVLNDAPELRHRISSYRAGFLPEERREIESRLFSGEMDGVISTSALEMGIDVGGLDLCLLVGYPGTIINTWQRGGRVGRSGRSSCIVLIAGYDALDQYFLNNPQDFFNRNCEEAILDPFNAEVLRKHLPCAAAETPLDPDEAWIKIPEVSSVAADLEQEGKLHRTKVNGHLHCGATRPQRDVDLRGIGTSYPIFLDDRRTMIGTSGGIRAFTECHEGAIYLHRARQFIVTKLDLERRNVFVKPTKVDYYTKALSEKDTEILGHPIRSKEFEGFTVREARLKVTEHIVGYEKRRTQGQELIGTVELNLPPVHFETVGIWIEIPDTVKTLIEDSDLHFMGGIHALEHAAISMFPLFALCDRNDIGGISTPQHPQVCKAAVFIYDGHPGGVGLAHRAFDLIWDLLVKTLKLVQGCKCEEGCPSCIHSPKCGSGNKPLDKDACIAVLDYLLHPEKLKSPVVGRRGKPKGQSKTIVRAKPAKIELQTINEDPEIIPPWRSKPQVKIDRRKSPKGPLLFPDMAVDSASGSMTMPVALEFQASTKTPRPTQKQIEQAREVLFVNQFVGSAPQSVVVFDIETKKTAAEVGGWHRVRDMEIAVLVAHSESEGFRSFTEKNVDEFIRMLKKADLVVGFNHMRFDYEVLSAYTTENLRSLPNLDILQYVEKTIGFKLKLDHLAEFTLGRNKTANGLEAVEWFRQGRIDLVEEYCKEDVKITRDLYLHGLKNGYIQFRKKNLQICKLNVNWDFANLGSGFKSHHLNSSRGR